MDCRRQRGSDGHLRHTLSGHASGINSIVFSPDSRSIVASSAGDATVWDVASGRSRYVPDGPGGKVACLAISPNGRLLVLGGLDAWQIATADVRDLIVNRLQFSLRGQPSYISSAAFSPNGQRIVTAGLRDRSTKLWDASLVRQRWIRSRFL